jgi:hypothetical protein
MVNQILVCRSFGESETKGYSPTASIVSEQETSTCHCFPEEIREATACVSECESYQVRMPYSAKASEFKFLFTRLGPCLT